MLPQDLDFSKMERAIRSLESALQNPPHNDLERDGTIQRFEYTFEICWKMIRKWLVAQGRVDVSSSPRPLLRDALQENLLSDLPAWFSFLEARNQVAHIYEESIALVVYATAQDFLPFAWDLYTRLRKTAQ